MEKRKSDRPFGLIALSLGDYGRLETYTLKVRKSIFKGPTLLVYHGIPASFSGNQFFDIAPSSASYRGVSAEYLDGCDHIVELTKELDSESHSDISQQDETDSSDSDSSSD